MGLINDKIKQFREQKNLSIEELAERSGVSVDVLSAIEKGNETPSSAVIIKVSRALGLRVDTLLEVDSVLGPVFTKAGEVHNSTNFSNGKTSKHDFVNYSSLTQGRSDCRINPFIVDINDNNQSMSSHEGEEFIYVLEGSAEVVYGNQTYSLEKGDSLYFDSVVSHCVKAKNGGSVKLLAVLYSPID